MPRKKSTGPGFEKSLQELEDLVAKMEQGDLSLEDSLQHFEKGVQLSRACQQSGRGSSMRDLISASMAAMTRYSAASSRRRSFIRSANRVFCP